MLNMLILREEMNNEEKAAKEKKCGIYVSEFALNHNLSFSFSGPG